MLLEFVDSKLFFRYRDFGREDADLPHLIANRECLSSQEFVNSMANCGTRSTRVPLWKTSFVNLAASRTWVQRGPARPCGDAALWRRPPHRDAPTESAGTAAFRTSLVRDDESRSRNFVYVLTFPRVFARGSGSPRLGRSSVTRAECATRWVRRGGESPAAVEAAAATVLSITREASTGVCVCDALRVRNPVCARDVRRW